jgi:hypothetical protein
MFFNKTARTKKSDNDSHTINTTSRDGTLLVIPVINAMNDGIVAACNAT